jgi:hypothetical protein
MYALGKNKKTIIYFSWLRWFEADLPGFLAGGGMGILFRHSSSVRLSGVIVGKLRREEIRE